jgi:hypothetical protein
MPLYTASHPRRLESPVSLRELQIAAKVFLLILFQMQISEALSRYSLFWDITQFRLVVTDVSEQPTGVLEP